MDPMVAPSWSFSISISPSNEYLGFTYFRNDWFDLLAVHGPLESRPHHHRLKESFHGGSVLYWLALVLPGVCSASKEPVWVSCWRTSLASCRQS